MVSVQLCDLSDILLTNFDLTSPSAQKFLRLLTVLAGGLDFGI